MTKSPWKFKAGVIGTITSSTTMAGSIRVTENLADMFAAEGRLDLFELPEAMILKPIAEADKLPADLQPEGDAPKNNKPGNKNKNKNKNKTNNDEVANTQ